jgi:hypothetical protein
MLIRIKSCSDRLLWYWHYVGKYFEVIKQYPDDNSYLVHEPSGYTNIVLEKDAEVMKW